MFHNVFKVPSCIISLMPVGKASALERIGLTISISTEEVLQSYCEVTVTVDVEEEEVWFAILIFFIGVTCVLISE